MKVSKNKETKLNGIRKNVAQYNDADYLDELSPEDREFYRKFTSEYYCNNLNAEGSLHKERLSPEQFEQAKKETYDNTNAQNRDTYGIGMARAYEGKSFITFIEDEKWFSEIADEDTPLNLSIGDPQYAFNIFFEQTLDELESDTGRSNEVILHEFGKECVRLGATLRKDKVTTALRRQKEKKEAKERDL